MGARRLSVDDTMCTSGRSFPERVRRRIRTASADCSRRDRADAFFGNTSPRAPSSAGVVHKQLKVVPRRIQTGSGGVAHSPDPLGNGVIAFVDSNQTDQCIRKLLRPPDSDTVSSLFSRCLLLHLLQRAHKRPPPMRGELGAIQCRVLISLLRARCRQTPRSPLRAREWRQRRRGSAQPASGLTRR